MATGLRAAVAELLAEQLPTPMRFAGMRTFGTSAPGDVLLSHFGLDAEGIALASGSFCSRSRAQLAATATPQVSGACGRNDGNAAGQRRVRAQVASDFYPVSISCGCRVSCAETLLVDGVLARWAVRARSEPAADRSAPNADRSAPDFLAMSERFAGKAHYI